MIIFGVWLWRRAENGAIIGKNDKNTFIFKTIYGIIKYIQWNAQNLSGQSLIIIIINVFKLSYRITDLTPKLCYRNLFISLFHSVFLKIPTQKLLYQFLISISIDSCWDFIKNELYILYQTFSPQHIDYEIYKYHHILH